MMTLLTGGNMTENTLETTLQLSNRHLGLSLSSKAKTAFTSGRIMSTTLLCSSSPSNDRPIDSVYSRENDRDMVFCNDKGKLFTI
jgi:hypothetical protein